MWLKKALLNIYEARWSFIIVNVCICVPIDYHHMMHQVFGMLNHNLKGQWPGAKKAVSSRCAVILKLNAKLEKELLIDSSDLLKRLKGGENGLLYTIFLVENSNPFH